MKKVILLSDTIRATEQSFTEEKHIFGIKVFTKNASGLRLANQVRKKGIEVKTVYNFTSFTIQEFDSIFEKISENKTKEFVLCISTSFLAYGILKNKNSRNMLKETEIWGVNYNLIMSILKLAKLKYNSTVIMGGWAVGSFTISSSVLVFKDYVDLFVSGDGTDIIAKFAGNNNVKPKGNLITSEGSKLFISSDIKDFTDQSSYPIIEDNIMPGESLTTETASGCIFSCSFCNYTSLGKKKHEFVRSYDSLKREFEHNYKNFGTTLYTFTDNIMNDYAPKLEMIVKIKEELGVDIKWVGYVRLDTIKNKQQVQLLKDSGCVGATFGIESFTKTVGPYIGKMTDGDKLKENLHIFREVMQDDCIVTTSIIGGVPTETPDMFIKTYEFLISKEGNYLVDTADFSRLILFPNQGTKNEINAARMNGDPFKDYIKKGPIEWVSPWGDSVTFEKLCNKFLYQGIKKNTFAFAFNLPILHNSGVDLKKSLYYMRNNIPFPKEITENFKIQKEKNIQQYKMKVLND